MNEQNNNLNQNPTGSTPVPQNSQTPNTSNQTQAEQQTNIVAETPTVNQPNQGNNQDIVASPTPINPLNQQADYY